MVNIKRKSIIYASLLIVLLFSFSPILVNGEGTRVFDGGNLFTQDQINQLNIEADRISQTHNMDIIILTTNDAQGKSSRDYADDFYDDNGFGFGSDLDGILFLLDLDNGEAYISTSGLGIRYLTDERIEGVLDKAYDGGLSGGDYFNGSMGFLSGTKVYLESGIPSDQYSEDENAKPENKLTLTETLMGLLGGMGGAGGFFLRTKSKYKMKNPVKPLTFRNNSIINLTSNDDRLVDTVTSHRIIPKVSNNNSSSGKSTTHQSSSGKTHGGGGRKL